MAASSLAPCRPLPPPPPVPTHPTLEDWLLWLRVAHGEARRRLFRPMVAEEIAERALFEVLQLHLLGRPPAAPTAYLRVVVRRLAARWLASADARCQPLEPLLQDAADRPGTHVRDPAGTRPETMRCSIAESADGWRVAIEILLPELERALTPRQLRALRAVRASRGLRAAARACAMTPRDLRAAIRRIAEKARSLLSA